MQQYFSKEELTLGLNVELDDELLHHVKTVLRKRDGYKFRMIDANNRCFLMELVGNQGTVLQELVEDNELDVDVTIILALIKNDKFDFALQKLTELGVSRIVPYAAERSVVKINDEKKKLERYRKIVTEASEQCHRLVIPEITSVAHINDLKDYMSDFNYVAYEKEKGQYIPYLDIDKSISVIIGPEGGFSPTEIEKIESLGFVSRSLGKRILRAETAALYVMSNVGGARER